jgi:dephospho-CoA kinase
MILGLLGGIGSGKSAVATELARHGGLVINADQFGHEALRQPELQRQVIAHFGQNIVDAAGAIDRKKLGAKVFADGKQLRALEAIVFPYIGQRIREEIDRSRRRAVVRFIVLDAAVMLEAGWNDVCDKLIFVDAPRSLRLERVRQQRGWSEADLQAREALQLPLEEKRRRADAVIRNDGASPASGAQVESLLRQWGLLSVR